MLAGTSVPSVTHFVAVLSRTGPTTVDLPQSGTIVISRRDLLQGAIRTNEKKEFTLPASYLGDRQKYDALKALRKCIKPKLFFCDTHDILVSVESIQQIYNHSAEPKMIHELNTEHDYRLHPEVTREVNKTLRQFLEKYKSV
jgi:hypothetical protein